MGVALAAPPAVQDPPLEKPQTFWSWVQVGFIFMGIGVAAWQLNGRPLMADVAARSAHQFAQKDNLLNAIAAGERAVALWPVEPAHHLLLGSVYWQQAVANPVTAQTQLARAEAALLAARQLQPEDPTIWLHTAQFYISVARQFGGETRPLADAAYGQALQLAPNQAAIYTDWGRVYLAEGDAEAAAPLLRQAVRLDASSGEAYLYLGAAELALGRLEIALADYQEAVRLLPESSEAYAGLADGYWRLDRPQEARWAVAEALRRDPHNTQAVALRQLMGERP
jgi:tetratricopeptide (TPR) repeat protein